jgi:hypothetical protein
MLNCEARLTLVTWVAALVLTGCSQREAPAPETAGTRSSAVAEKGLLHANPNPIKVCDGSELGETTLSWKIPAADAVEVHVGSPTGARFAANKGSGSSRTGKWVKEGTEFVLISMSRRSEVDHLTMHLTSVGCR